MLGQGQTDSVADDPEHEVREENRYFPHIASCFLQVS